MSRAHDSTESTRRPHSTPLHSQSFDANDDGSISREELRQAMERLGEKLSDAELDAMISAADVNKDGKARAPLSPLSRLKAHPRTISSIH